MAVSWRLVGRVLVVTESGVSSNDEIERAIVGDALSDPRCAVDARIPWQQGRLARFALLTRRDQRTTTELVRSEVPKAASPLVFAVFTDDAEAVSWLEA
jgi:hypothetical protein